MKIKTEWIKGLKGNDVTKRKELVLQNKILLDFLVEILYNMNERLEEVSLDDYNSPSWSHKQAHLNGQRDMLRKIVDLCTISADDPRQPI